MSATVAPRAAGVAPAFVFDGPLVAAIVALAAIGALAVGSASISLAERETGEPLYYLMRHLGALGLGAAACAVMASR
jgi:cell division protein FtsW (lipid II flippase)